jgi:hypothetical protein
MFSFPQGVRACRKGTLVLFTGDIPGFLTDCGFRLQQMAVERTERLEQGTREGVE